MSWPREHVIAYCSSQEAHACGQSSKVATQHPSALSAGTSYTTTEANGPQFARTFVLRRKGWDHHMELLAGIGSDAAITAQVLTVRPCTVLVGDHKQAHRCCSHLRLPHGRLLLPGQCVWQRPAQTLRRCRSRMRSSTAHLILQTKPHPCRSCCPCGQDDVCSRRS
jgi:hypothetical protein